MNDRVGPTTYTAVVTGPTSKSVVVTPLPDSNALTGLLSGSYSVSIQTAGDNGAGASSTATFTVGEWACASRCCALPTPRTLGMAGRAGPVPEPAGSLQGCEVVGVSAAPTLTCLPHPSPSPVLQPPPPLPPSPALQPMPMA